MNDLFIARACAPNSGNVGTAAYLNVFGSIFRVLKALRKEGYTIDLPKNENELIEAVLKDKEAKIQSPELNVAYRMPVSEYEVTSFSLPSPHPQKRKKTHTHKNKQTNKERFCV